MLAVHQLSGFRSSPAFGFCHVATATTGIAYLEVFGEPNIGYRETKPMGSMFYSCA